MPPFGFKAILRFSHSWESVITDSYIIIIIDIAKYIKVSQQTVLLLIIVYGDYLKEKACYVNPVFSAGAQYKPPFQQKAYGCIHFQTGWDMKTSKHKGLIILEPDQVTCFGNDFRHGMVAQKVDSPAIKDLEDGYEDVDGREFIYDGQVCQALWVIPKKLP